MSISSFINTKAKTIVIFLFSIISLGVLIVSTLISSIVFEEWYGIVFGIILMIIAIPFHISGRKMQFGYLISFALNSVANGLSLSALYNSDKFTLDIFTMILAAIPAAAILFLVYLMLQIFNKTKKVTVTVACILNFALTVALIVLWIKHGNLIFSFGFFCSLISFFLPLCFWDFCKPR